MANGVALAEGITHLAETYCGEDRDGVQVTFDESNDWSISVSLVVEQEITPATADFMVSRGFTFRPAAGEGIDPNPYHSYFSLAL